MKKFFSLKDDFLREIITNYDIIDYETKIVEGRLCKILAFNHHTLFQMLMTNLISNSQQRFDRAYLADLIDQLKNEEFLIDYKTNQVYIPDCLSTLYKGCFISIHHMKHFNILFYIITFFMLRFLLTVNFPTKLSRKKIQRTIDC